MRQSRRKIRKKSFSAQTTLEEGLKNMVQSLALNQKTVMSEKRTEFGIAAVFYACGDAASYLRREKHVRSDVDHKTSGSD